MTTPHRTLLQQALDALENSYLSDEHRNYELQAKAIAAIREALAADHFRNVAEKVAPAAPVVPNGCEKIFTHKWLDPDCIEQGCKSLAAPVVPLTDEQIWSMWKSSEFRGNGGQADWFCEGIRAAEAHHGITGASK